MITRYLIELLYDHECVVIPNFGAFITKHHSAVVDYANNHFMPPYKEIAFNSKLVNNDDLLINYISETDKISYDSAASIVQKFVDKCNALLDHKAEVEFENFGTLHLSFMGEFVFEAKENLNILGDSFGLTDFKVQPIFRSDTYQLIKEHILVDQKEKETAYSSADDSANHNARINYKYVKSILYVATFFALILLINFTTEKSGSNFASWNPFLYSSPNEFIINLLDDNEAVDLKTVDPETVIEDDIVNTIDSTESVALETETVPETLVVQEELVEEIVVKHHYFIIGGSFQTDASAEKCLHILKNQGFENASVMAKNEKGNIRVYYDSFVHKSEALLLLDKIKREYNESAWLLFQK